MEITKIKIGSNIYDVKDVNAIGSSDVTKIVNQEIYGSETKPSGATVVTSQNITTIAQGAGFSAGDNDTKNTAGATNNTDAKMYLVGAPTQGANPQTYSNSGCYVGTDNCLYTNGSKTTNSTDVANAINTELYGSASKPSGAYAVTNQNLANAITAAGISTGGSGVSTYYQLGYTVTNINGSGALTIPGTDPVYLVSVTDNISSVALTTNPPYGHSCHVIFKSANSSSHTVLITHDAVNSICPDGEEVALTVPAAGQGYIEIDFLNMGNSTTGNEVYVRGI